MEEESPCHKSYYILKYPPYTSDHSHLSLQPGSPTASEASRIKAQTTDTLNPPLRRASHSITAHIPGQTGSSPETAAKLRSKPCCLQENRLVAGIRLIFSKNNLSRFYSRTASFSNSSRSSQGHFPTFCRTRTWSWLPPPLFSRPLSTLQ